jgi:hypothetical protein
MISVLLTKVTMGVTSVVMIGRLGKTHRRFMPFTLA